MSPGHVERKFFVVADISVDVHGLHSARWRKYTDQLLIWTCINYRQSDVQEFLIPLYFHFVCVLEGPCREMFDCRVFCA